MLCVFYLDQNVISSEQLFLNDYVLVPCQYRGSPLSDMTWLSCSTVLHLNWRQSKFFRFNVLSRIRNQGHQTTALPSDPRLLSKWRNVYSDTILKLHYAVPGVFPFCATFTLTLLHLFYSLSYFLLMKSLNRKYNHLINWCVVMDEQSVSTQWLNSAPLLPAVLFLFHIKLLCYFLLIIIKFLCHSFYLWIFKSELDLYIHVINSIKLSTI